jgi:RimJ/RimL family protein N-acetyltransferase
VPKFEIGYWCRTKFEGRGYITDAVNGILRFGFEVMNARRIEIRSDARNAHSLRVAERVGLVREGVLRNDGIGTDGTLRDRVIFALTDADWQRRKTVR